MLIMLSLFDFNIIFVDVSDIKIMIEINLLFACNDRLCILSFILLHIVHLVYLSGEPVGR